MWLFMMNCLKFYEMVIGNGNCLVVCKLSSAFFVASCD